MEDTYSLDAKPEIRWRDALASSDASTKVLMALLSRLPATLGCLSQ